MVIIFFASGAELRLTIMDWRAIATDFIYCHDGAHQIHACGKSNTKMRAIRHCCKAMDAAVKKYNLE